MKVIDLYNKMAKGEEVPRKFTYKGYLWEYDVKNKMWFYYFGESKSHRFDRLFYMNMILNDTVEILEGEKETKSLTKKDIEALGYACGEIQKSFTNGWTKALENKPLEEENKIPEKLDDFDIQGLEVSGYSMTQAEYLLEDGVKENRKIINWILDYLKSKGDE
jgi:hypothetical protein